MYGAYRCEATTQTHTHSRTHTHTFSCLFSWYSLPLSMQMTFIMQMHANQIQPSENQGWEKRTRHRDWMKEWKRKGTQEKSAWVAGGGKLGKCSPENNSSPIGQTWLHSFIVRKTSFFIWFSALLWFYTPPLGVWRSSLLLLRCKHSITWNRRHWKSPADLSLCVR